MKGRTTSPTNYPGPYDVQLQSDVIYPPSALFLFVPFAVAPWWLWWVVPIAITGYVIWRWRPAWWGVAAMLTLLCWPRAHAAFPYGNTDMWAMAGVAAALMWGWPSGLSDPEADLRTPGSDRYHRNADGGWLLLCSSSCRCPWPSSGVSTSWRWAISASGPTTRSGACRCSRCPRSHGSAGLAATGAWNGDCHRHSAQERDDIALA